MGTMSGTRSRSIGESFLGGWWLWWRVSLGGFGPIGDFMTFLRRG